ncbi:hypothetical protein ACP4OV_022123 [Aristida adscensionis]
MPSLSAARSSSLLMAILVLVLVASPISSEAHASSGLTVRCSEASHHAAIADTVTSYCAFHQLCDADTATGDVIDNPAKHDMLAASGLIGHRSCSRV